MKGSSSEHESKETQERILEAAKKIFSDKGFDATSIREITAEASCNIAAVHYHFGSKEGLYETLLRTALKKLTDHRVRVISEVLTSTDPSPDLTMILEAFVQSFLEPLLHWEGGVRFLRIFQWEMLHPILPPDLFYEEMIQPTMDVTVRAIKTVCPDMPPSLIHLSIMSIVGQLLHIVHMQGFFRCVQDHAIPDIDLDHLISHVVSFSEAGIRAYTGSATQ